MANNVKAGYNESSFRVLKGLEPVRERPGMYTRTDNPLHILQEVIDNAADEALAGFAKKIDVTFLPDGGVCIEDNGRGVPVGLHPEEGVPVVELAFTRLHAGGKFDKTSGGGAYAFSGGLHGVGVAVTTALSHKVIVDVKRDGTSYQVEFSDGGRQIGNVKEMGRCPKSQTGTRVTIWPDAKYFGTPKVPMNEIERLLRSKAVFLKGVTVSLTVEGQTKTWDFPNGVGQYLGDLMCESETVAPAFVCEKFIAEDDSSKSGNASSVTQFSVGEGASFALAWTAEGGSINESYVNLIPTGGGGTHESGLKAGVFEAVRSFVEHHGLLPRGVKLQQEDVAARLSYVLAAKVLDPQFQGQTKDRLNSREAHKLLVSVVRDPFEAWLNANIDHAKAIADLAIRQAQSRQKTGQKIEKRKSSSVVVLPGKLADCEATEGNELFLVEGDSAGGSAKNARNRETQAILPLRGKVLNTWEVEQGRLFANQEIHDISVAIGVDPHGPVDGVKDSEPVKDMLTNLRYERIIIMTDADVDGAHIQTLLLTLFYRHFPQVILKGHLFIALSPLYRVDVAAISKNKPARRLYALDEHERDSMLEKLKREGVSANKIEIGRFKGLGEMNASQLRETSMDPATRRVLPVSHNVQDAKTVNAMFNLLMGESQAAGRRDWMSKNGATVEADA